MKEVLIGTHNRHKLAEISRYFADLPLAFKTLNDFPHVQVVEEDEETLEGNAVKKAHFYSKATGLFTIADDTGLEIAALNGEPGVYSARYAGENCSYEDNNRKVLDKLAKLGDPDRHARFRCVIACCDARTGFLKIAQGSIEGEITRGLQGSHGFGYDPIFYLPQQKKTLAEFTLDEKNRISHRAQALAQAKLVLQEAAK